MCPGPLKPLDCLIVGQGLAGSLLSYALRREGLHTAVLDDGHRSSSSMVAAGLWNPISFKKNNITWLAPQLLEQARITYHELEHELGISFFHPKEMARLFPDAFSANLWDERCSHPEMKPWISPGWGSPVAPQLNEPFGHGVVVGAGWMDIPAFLYAWRKKLELDMSLVSETFEFSRVQLIDGMVHYGDLICHKLIFCTGYKNGENPWFEWIPIIPNKGEVLTVHVSGLPESQMIHFGQFLLPLGNQLWKTGATYAIGETDPAPTASAQQHLLGKLQETYSGECTVKDHRAGFRPTTPDRRPVIGLHPEHPELALFNGFGSKGVLLIPWFARQFARHLAGLEPASDECRITRFRERANK